MEVFLTPNQVLISCPYFIQNLMEILVTYGLYLFFPNYKYKILHYARTKYAQYFETACIK